MTDKDFPRVIVPFAFVAANTDSPGLKDFSPAVLPADAPDEEEGDDTNGGEVGDGADPKVSPSSAPASVPATAEKDSPTKDKVPTE
jgi:hypothetical protein